ncbi:hypothetical protein KI387_000465, partial [Taxus chinensis]
ARNAESRGVRKKDRRDVNAEHDLSAKCRAMKSGGQPQRGSYTEAGDMKRK